MKNVRAFYNSPFHGLFKNIKKTLCLIKNWLRNLRNGAQKGGKCQKSEILTTDLSLIFFLKITLLTFILTFTQLLYYFLLIDHTHCLTSKSSQYRIIVIFCLKNKG